MAKKSCLTMAILMFFFFFFWLLSIKFYIIKFPVIFEDFYFSNRHFLGLTINFISNQFTSIYCRSACPRRLIFVDMYRTKVEFNTENPRHNDSFCSLRFCR